MEIKETRFDDARKVFKRLIYDWTFESATFYQFRDFTDDEADDLDSYWFQGAKGLKNVYDWYWDGHMDDWDAFAEYFTNKILDVIPEIIKDVMEDYGIEKGDDDEKEIEIDFYEYGLSNRLYHDDDINFDVVRYVYENNTDLFNRLISKMMDDMGFHNINFEVKFKG